MSDTIRRLEVVTPQMEIDEAVVRILEEALADAKAGKIKEVVVLSYRPDDPDREPWDFHISPTQRLMAWIGHLEATKLDWLLNSQKDN